MKQAKITPYQRWNMSLRRQPFVFSRSRYDAYVNFKCQVHTLLFCPFLTVWHFELMMHLFLCVLCVVRWYYDESCVHYTIITTSYCEENVATLSTINWCYSCHYSTSHSQTIVFDTETRVTSKQIAPKSVDECTTSKENLADLSALSTQ